MNVIEVIGKGGSIQDAVDSAIKQSSKSINDIFEVYVEGIEASIQGGKIVSYQINARIFYGKNQT